jgi:hypothetical protein
MEEQITKKATEAYPYVEVYDRFDLGALEDKRNAFMRGYRQALKDQQQPSLCNCTEKHDPDEIQRNKCDDCRRRIK